MLIYWSIFNLKRNKLNSINVSLDEEEEESESQDME
jgi:hypothetical protein